MIGPHEGKELELMLAGQKALAVFHDAVPASGIIAEEIIPEKKFAPYVVEGKIKRFSEDIYAKQGEASVRYVCFALPTEAWRAEFFLWHTRELYAGRLIYNIGQEHIIGGLLGYSAEDINQFIQQKTQFVKNKTIV